MSAFDADFELAHSVSSFADISAELPTRVIVVIVFLFIVHVLLLLMIFHLILYQSLISCPLSCVKLIIVKDILFSFVDDPFGLLVEVLRLLIILALIKLCLHQALVLNAALGAVSLRACWSSLY